MRARKTDKCRKKRTEVPMKFVAFESMSFLFHDHLKYKNTRYRNYLFLGKKIKSLHYGKLKVQLKIKLKSRLLHSYNFSDEFTAFTSTINI